MMNENRQIEAEQLDMYVNSLGINMSPYEFVLQFGKTEFTNVEALKESVILRMSPQHAKSVLLLLTRFITLYESQIAPIVLPQELSQRIRDEGIGTDDSN